MSEKSEKERLEEAEKVAEMRERGMTYAEIADEMDIGKSTAHSRMKTWEKHIGSERETDEEKLEDAGTIIQTVRGILSDVESSRKLGEISGADLATIRGTLKRIMEKKATKSEIHKIFANISGAIRGYIEGGEVHKALNLPDRKSMAEKKEVDELKEELEELKAVVGGKSEKEKKKKKESEEE